MKPKERTAPKKNTALARPGGGIRAVAQVATEIRDLIEAARDHVSVTANLALVNLYWNVGRIITQDIQKNETRAEYRRQLVEQLSAVLMRDCGRGYSVANLWDMKRFFGCFEILQPTAVESASDRIVVDFRKHFRLGWTHYRMLLNISDPVQRRFYFEQAASQHWSKREFRCQIDRGLFERVALSKDTPRLVAQEKRQSPPEEIVPYDSIFKDPYVLDFLGLKGTYSERDLEAAIVHNLEQFLTELGTDFCFIGRQHVELLLRHGPHKMKVAEYLTRLPDKRLLEERLKLYGKLLKDRDGEYATETDQ